MKRQSLIVFLLVICMCIPICTPMLVFANRTILPPVDVEVDFILLGWPGEIPESLQVRWQPSETDGITSYNIYEVITGEDGITEYVKVGGTNNTSCYIEGNIFGYHGFAVTSVMPDGRESDYSEIATGGLFYKLEVRDIGTTSSNISIEWDDSPAFQDADGYEIWYRVDDYEYWQYYNDFYNKKEIQYETIGDIDGNTKSYTISGLQPDTEYVIMVRAYSNGEILDYSDFLQVKTENGFDEAVVPPTGVKVDFILLGWPGGIPESLRVQWQPSETDGIASYNIYEVITGEDGITEYVKVGSTNETNCYIDGRFLGYHSFAVTSVMPDGRESDYSEIATGGMFHHLRVRDIGTTSSSISIEWDSPEFQDADGYEILYRVDDYEYWQYYVDYYGEKKMIQYKKIGDIDGNTKNYTINGLQPDTEYVIMVLAYSNGEILDSSDFLRAKTMSGFVENKINISKASITIEKTVYNGKVQKPKVTVKYNEKKLSLNKDFTVTYKNSKNVGKAKATITGIGNYTGTKSISFTILPKANKVSKLTNKKAGKLVVKISKSKGVKGYEISYATNKKFTSARKKKTTGTSVTLKSIKKNKTYYVRVRAYAKIDGKTVYSSYSPVESIKIRK